MENTRKTRQTTKVCTCNHEAPGVFTFTSPTFSHEIARRACALNISGTQTWDFAVEELGQNHSGALADHEGDLFPFRDDVNSFDDALRICQKGHINKIKVKGRPGWTGKKRLQDRMIYTMLVLFFALEVHDCRTSGPCADRANTQAKIRPR